MITYRNAITDDLIQIRELLKRGIDEEIKSSQGDLIKIDDYSFNDSFVQDAINKESAVVFVADKDKKILGYIIAYESSQPVNAPFLNNAKRLFIDSLDVDSNSRNQGIASNLIHSVEVWARERGYQELSLSVYKENEKAKNLYIHKGFSTIKENMRKKL